MLQFLVMLSSFSMVTVSSFITTLDLFHQKPFSSKVFESIYRKSARCDVVINCIGCAFCTPSLWLGYTL